MYEASLQRHCTIDLSFLTFLLPQTPRNIRIYLMHSTYLILISFQLLFTLAEELTLTEHSLFLYVCYFFRRVDPFLLSLGAAGLVWLRENQFFKPTVNGAQAPGFTSKESLVQAAAANHHTESGCKHSFSYLSPLIPHFKTILCIANFNTSKPNIESFVKVKHQACGGGTKDDSERCERKLFS